MGYRRFPRGQQGDTIVEVLISIVVVASVLGGAFVVSNNSSKNVRKSQEHTEALQILQGQVERFRAFAADQPNQASATITNQCLDTSLNRTSACGFGDENRYTVSLRTTPSMSNTVTVVGTVTWEQLGGGTAKETLAYRAEVNR